MFWMCFWLENYNIKLRDVQVLKYIYIYICTGLHRFILNSSPIISEGHSLYASEWSWLNAAGINLDTFYVQDLDNGNDSQNPT